MSITDELRDYIKQFLSQWGWDKHKLTEIADRIDAEHERQLEVLYRDMSDAEYVKLPKDANGEYVHVGDVMVYADGNTKPMEVVALVPPAVFLTEDGPRYADMCRHYHAPTVEDVLREFGDWYAHTKGGCDEDGIIAEYAAKLQLKEDE